MSHRLLALCGLALAAILPALGLAHAGLAAGGTAPLISDERPYSFAVSWTTTSPTAGRIQVQINGKWQSFADMRGAITSTTHLFMIPCNVSSGRSCKQTLKPNAIYAVRVSGAGGGTVTLHARTTAVLSPVVPLAAIGGHVQGKDGKASKDALIYAVAHDKGTSSVPLATLTLPNGNWLIALANAVTTDGKAFPLHVGDTVRVTVLSGATRAGTTIHLKTLQQPTLVKRPLTLH